jgi:hypothetical protein
VLEVEENLGTGPSRATYDREILLLLHFLLQTLLVSEAVMLCCVIGERRKEIIRHCIP